MSVHEPHPQGSANRPTLGWLVATLTGGALMLSNAGCSATPEDEPVEDIEVHLPTHAEADAAAGKSISAADADAAYRKLLEELDEDS